VKLAVVVQRYGAEINGGAELHARYVAEHLAKHHEVEVLTTCARDYVTWANEVPAGVEEIHGVRVRRFPVAHERDVRVFARRQEAVFERVHSIGDELAWLDAEGPTSPALLRFIRDERGTFDVFIFFSYRYWHAFHGLRAVHDRSVLVPTAERDPAIGLSIFPPLFRAARAIMFNSFEERAMIRHVAGSADLPGTVVGVGSEIPERPNADRFRQEFGITERFAVYVGRIDRNKGCDELFDHFQWYARSMPGELHLVLIGKSILPIPDHPRIHHLGFLTDRQKFDAIAAADVLVMPSYYESLSMVALEAWALGRPVLANARCDVLKGQAIRSNAGLYYESYPEFAEALYAIASSHSLRHMLGQNGRAYFRRHYAWPVIERKYLDTLDRIARDGISRAPALEPLPGFFARRRAGVPAASDVLATVPAGPSLS
jgi:glycosyltransferase involved in cell wall biosynthesis